MERAERLMPEPESKNPTTPESLLDPQALAHAELLGLHARQVVEGHLAGEHRSPFFGFATEFAAPTQMTMVASRRPSYSAKSSASA